MAAIISSAYALGHAQRNGTRYVTETHTWDTGEITTLEYGPVPDTVDYQAVANGRATRIMETRALQEFEELIGGA